MLNGNCFQGPKADETPASTSGETSTTPKTSADNFTRVDGPKTSTDSYKNYAVVAGIATAAAAVGWYLGSKKTKPEVQD